MMPPQTLNAFSLACVFALSLGCQGDGGAKAPPDGSLYDRLGGDRTITAVVDDFVARAAANPRVNFTRKGTAKEWRPTDGNVAHLKKMMVDFISANTGGPHRYTGKQMKEVHAGMQITNAEFDAAAGDLIAALDKFKVPQKEKDELIAIVATTRKDVVEVK